MKTFLHSWSAAWLLAQHLVPATAAFSDPPNATVIPLWANDCREWPNYQNVRGVDVTGAFTFVSAQTQDEGSNGLRVQAQPYRDGNNGTHRVLVVDVRKSGLLSTIMTSHCNNGTVFYGYAGLEAKPPFVVDSNSGVLRPEGTGLKLEPYAHAIDGVRQPGVFLGARNLTTWGFDYVQPADCGSRDYYSIWLLGVSDRSQYSPGGRTPMLRGFIKAEGL